jgi:hypothetical protein
MAEKPPARLSRLAEDLVSSFRHVDSEDPSRSKLRPTQELPALIEELMQKHQIGRPSAEQSIRDEWVAIVGPANAMYSHAVRIERGRLWVQASHAVVRNEIFMHKEEIVARIRLIPGCQEVKSIRVGPS